MQARVFGVHTTLLLTAGVCGIVLISCANAKGRGSSAGHQLSSTRDENSSSQPFHGDPRTFVPRGNYVPGQGVIPTMNGLVHRSPTISEDLPPCKHRMDLNSRPRLTPVLDGSLAEWKLEHLAGIDRAGDGLKLEGQSFDLREVYYAEDSDNVYVAIVTNEPWPIGGARKGYLEVSFSPKHPKEDISRRYLISGDAVQRDLGNGLQLIDKGAQAPVKVAVKDRAVEMSFAKTELRGLPESYSTLVRIASDATADIDHGVTHTVGMVDKYRCLVEMPDRSTKLLVMRHDPGVTAVPIETLFRSAIAAVPAVEAALGMGLAHTDTIPVHVTFDIDTTGQWWTEFGMILFSGEGYTQELAGTWQLFVLAAHEYAHAFNAGDLGFPSPWMSEGHSEWAARRAFALYYGREAAHLFDVLARSYYIYEKGAADLRQWDKGDVHYPKSWVLWDAVSKYAGLNAVDGLMKQIAKREKVIQTDGDLLQAFAQLPGFPAKGGNPWSGWFGGAYSSSSFFTPELLLDQDGDGFTRYEEKAMGTSDQSRDSDGDRLPDDLEVWLGRNPAKTEPPPANKLFMDGDIWDWDQLSSAGFQKPATSMTSNCTNPHGIARFAAIDDGQDLIVGVEFNGQTGFQTILQLWIEWPDRSRDRFAIDTDGVMVARQRSFETMATAASGFKGNRAEFAIPYKELKRSGHLPSGTKIQLVSFDAQNYVNTRLCHKIENIVPKSFKLR